MTRKKVKLAFISNDSARKATFKKRKKGLMKKVSELSTLCGIESCAVVYSPYESQPDVWPDARGAHRVVAQFKRMPEMEQSKKMVNQESFIRHRISKAADQLKKLHKDNREKEITHLMYHCLTGKALHGLALPELNDMAWLIDQNLKEIYKRIDALKKAPPPTPTAPAPATQDNDDHHVACFADWMGSTDHSDHQQNQMGANFGNPNTTTAASASAAGDDIIVPFSDANINNPAAAAMWSNVFFP